MRKLKHNFGSFVEKDMHIHALKVKSKHPPLPHETRVMQPFAGPSQDKHRRASTQTSQTSHQYILSHKW